MIETYPRVYLISEPKILLGPMLQYLRDVGGEAWYERVVAPVVLQHGSAGATELVEFCGRLCYRSWRVGLNRNVTKVREDTGEYLLNILTSGHGSVIEHAHFTFVLRDVSRVFTAEWNRHRHPDVDGWESITQNLSEQSLRYVRLDNLRFRMPPDLPEEVNIAGAELLGQVEAFLEWAGETCGLDNEGDELSLKKPLHFNEKKLITSALRRFVPMGLSTDEVWTANLRDIRHVVETRTDPHAEEEIRIVANLVGEAIAERMPFFFNDYVHEPHAMGGPPTWVTEYEKV